jgi:NDP-sugar pyrophosphorylase family protein
MPISLENTLLNAQIEAGRRIVGFRSDAPFIDIGLPSDYHSAQSLPFFSNI